MLCVPRSWAASPWDIERMIVTLSAIFAVSFMNSPNWMPGMRGVDGSERPAIFGGRVGFRVERFLMGETAGQENLDDSLRHRFVSGVGLGCSKCLIPKELRQREPEPAEQADVKELTARAVSIKWISRADWFHGAWRSEYK